jgi:hypothetical protein
MRFAEGVRPPRFLAAGPTRGCCLGQHLLTVLLLHVCCRGERQPTAVCGLCAVPSGGVLLSGRPSSDAPPRSCACCAALSCALSCARCCVNSWSALRGCEPSMQRAGTEGGTRVRCEVPQDCRGRGVAASRRARGLCARNCGRGACGGRRTLQPTAAQTTAGCQQQTQSSVSSIISATGNPTRGGPDGAAAQVPRAVPRRALHLRQRPTRPAGNVQGRVAQRGAHRVGAGEGAAVKVRPATLDSRSTAGRPNAHSRALTQHPPSAARSGSRARPQQARQPRTASLPVPYHRNAHPAVPRCAWGCHRGVARACTGCMTASGHSPDVARHPVAGRAALSRPARTACVRPVARCAAAMHPLARSCAHAAPRCPACCTAVPPPHLRGTTRATNASSPARDSAKPPPPLLRSAPTATKPATFDVGSGQKLDVPADLAPLFTPFVVRRFIQAPLPVPARVPLRCPHRRRCPPKRPVAAHPPSSCSAARSVSRKGASDACVLLRAAASIALARATLASTAAGPIRAEQPHRLRSAHALPVRSFGRVMDV